MSAPPLFEDAMKVEGRVFIRVSREVRDQCEKIGQRWGMRAGAAARELILAGHNDGGVPVFPKEPSLVAMNVSFTDEMKNAIVEGARAFSQEHGIPMEVALYARRCLYRGIELAKADRRALVSVSGRKQRMYFEAGARR